MEAVQGGWYMTKVVDGAIIFHFVVVLVTLFSMVIINKLRFGIQFCKTKLCHYQWYLIKAMTVPILKDCILFTQQREQLKYLQHVWVKETFPEFDLGHLIRVEGSVHPQ